MILGASMIAVSEGFLLAEKLGLDAQKLFDIASKSSAQCWSMTSYCPVPGPVPTSPANRDYKPGFTVAMMSRTSSSRRRPRGRAAPRRRSARKPRRCTGSMPRTDWRPRIFPELFAFCAASKAGRRILDVAVC